jgi:hypothetical protein
MSITLSYQKRKARKDHICDFCGGIIKKDTIYQRQGIVHEHKLYTWKAHYRCLEICNKLDMFDNCDDGVTQEDFYEYINEEYYKLLADKDEPATRSFNERLEIVCANHLNSK